MAQTKQLPRTHAGKKTTDKEEQAIKRIQKDLSLAENRNVTWLEAKHIYFEDMEKIEKGSLAQQVADTTQDPPKKKMVLTIAEAKLGVTLVLSKEDCETIGIPSTTLTKDAVKIVRKKLGLAERRGK